MKIYYNSIGEIVDQNITEDTWVQGDEDSKILSLYFSGITLADYVCRVVIERGDGDTSNELVTTNMGTYYKLLIPAWVCAVSGTVKITSRLKIGSTVVIATTQAERVVSDGVLASDDSITNAEYAALLSLLDTILPIDASMSDTSEKVVQNKVIKAYIDNLARVKNTKIVGAYNVENYGYLGIGADLKPYYRIADNASAIPSDASTEVLHEGNIGTKGNIYNLGTFASLALMLASIQAKTYDKIYRAIVPINSVNLNALVMAKYVNGAFYVSGIAGNYLIFATFNGSTWTTYVKDFLTLEIDKIKLVSVSATGDSAPYSLVVVDADITSNSFVEIMPNDGIDETAYNDVLAENIYSKLFNVSVGGFEINVKTKNNDAPYLIMYKITEVAL